MRWVVLAAVGLCVLGGCGRSKGDAQTAPAASHSDVVPSANQAKPPPPPPPDASPRPRITLNLRSTPSGAQAAIDGHTVGHTPLVTEIDADGQPHDFSFSLPGYDVARYRFPATRNGGVVHATLRRQRDAAD